VVVPITGTVSGIEVPAGQTPSETTGRGTVTAPISIPGLPFAIHDMPIRIPGIGAFSGGVTVNVAGSVISENDLVETVRKGLVNSQRNGAGLVYSNR
jgi:alpha-D-ribose 1-methylphosphonate 5-phosphate C-P lyase